MDEEKKLPQKKEPSLINEVGKDIYNNMIRPRVLEIVTNMIRELIYTGSDSAVDMVSRLILKRSAPARGGNGKTNYSKASTNAVTVTSVPKPSDDLDYIVIGYQQEIDETDENGRKLSPREYADRIVEDLKSSIRKYDQVRVADLYEKVKHKTIYTDYNFGWTNVDDIHYITDRNGYWFNLPKPVPLKKG